MIEFEQQPLEFIKAEPVDDYEQNPDNRQSPENIAFPTKMTLRELKNRYKEQLHLNENLMKQIDVLTTERDEYKELYESEKQSKPTRSSYYIDPNDSRVYRCGAVITKMSLMQLNDIGLDKMYDMRFIGMAAEIVYGRDVLSVSTVSGRKRKNKNYSRFITAKEQTVLDPDYLCVVIELVEERVIRWKVGKTSSDIQNASYRTSLKHIQQGIRFKISNLKQKREKKRTAELAASEDESPNSDMEVGDIDDRTEVTLD